MVSVSGQISYFVVSGEQGPDRNLIWCKRGKTRRQQSYVKNGRLVNYNNVIESIFRVDSL